MSDSPVYIPRNINYPLQVIFPKGGVSVNTDTISTIPFRICSDTEAVLGIGDYPAMSAQSLMRSVLPLAALKRAVIVIPSYSQL